VQVRRPAVAGSFYPADPDALRAALEEVLRQAGSPNSALPVPKAIVVPHAGYRYSAPVAASAYARLLPLRERIERVVLLGPAHRSPHTPVAAPSVDAFETPLGLLLVDKPARDELAGAGLVVIDDLPHAAEHSLEVQLPCVQETLGNVHVLPLLVGEVSATAVAAVLETVWGGPETVVIVSTDLSHYHDHHTAEQLDRRTAQAVVDRRPGAVGPLDACGVFALRGLLLTAAQRDLDVELLDLRTSADTAGGQGAVVGYGAFALGARGSEVAS
jgi:AmmeMemoRadiSam system protein B